MIYSIDDANKPADHQAPEREQEPAAASMSRDH